MLIDPADPNPKIALLALGAVGDSRPLPEQPLLKEGIHLRWAFDHRPENRIGFPWYGFYLFRRLTPVGGAGTTCASTQFGGLTPGFRSSPDLSIPLGTFHSDKNLRLTDEFAPTGTIEFDLSGRDFIEFKMLQSQPCRRVQVKIGFVADFPPLGGAGPGPGTTTGPDGGAGTGTTFPPDGGGETGGGSGLGSRSGTSIGRGCGCGCDHAAIVPIAERVIQVAPGQYRATFGYRNGGATAISMPVGSENRFLPDPQDRGQPTTFNPGRRTDVFAVVFDGRPLTWRLAGHTVTVSAADASTPGDDTGGGDTGGGDTGDGGPTGGGPTGTGTSKDGIIITALRTGVEVATVVVAGRAGEVVTATIDFDAIDGVRVSAGPARLIDICATRVTDALTDGWEPVPNFPQPMCLPVSKEEYPCNPDPENEPAAVAMAVDRISYEKTRWTGNTDVNELYAELLQMVTGGPMKGITEFLETFPAEADPADPSADPPEVIEQSSLDMVLGASINPSVAQMLGLYWVDDTAIEGQSYDYLLVADYVNAAGRSLATVQSLVAAGDFSGIDVYYKSGAFRVVSPPLAAPRFAKSFSLPAGAPPLSVPGDAVGIAGLVWDIPLETNGRIRSDGPVLFHVWRASLGGVAPFDEVPDQIHVRLSDMPFTPGDLLSEPPEQVLTGWPAFGLFATDGPLVDGWYSYRINGIDLFGRFSGRSPSARWMQIDGVTPQPNDYALRIKDQIPPPPPAQVQAFALDPRDPFVTQDEAYDDWRNPTPPVPGRATALGLRVRWLWTGKHMRQAPDLREFRLYFHSGTQLPGAISAATWQTRIAVVDPDDNIIKDDLVSIRAGASASVSGNQITLGGSESLDGLELYGAEIELPAAVGRKRFLILDLDVPLRTILVDAAPALSGSSSWTIGMRVREYEVFLPNSGQAFDLPLSPTPATPLLYGLVGVSAADDKTESDEDPWPGAGALSNRYGNEGPVGGPITVYRVLRDPPGRAPLPPFQDTRLLATRADFYSRSYFMLHWSRTENLFTHVFRAVDQSLFQVDNRKGFNGSPRADELDELGYPPEWAPGRGPAAAAEINALGSFDDYASLGDDALRLLASLPSNSEAFTRLTRAPLGMPDVNGGDPDQVGPNDDPLDYEPQNDRGSYLDTLDGRAGNLYFYRTAAIDAAQNMGPLGFSTPPVALPTAVLPQEPVLIGVAGGDRSISLSWVAAVDRSIDTYRIYRADSAAAARTLGTMEVIDTVTDTRPPGSRTTPVTATDETVAPYQDYFYRITAVSPDGVESSAATAQGTRAFDGSPPPEPTWERSEWVKLDAEGGEHPFTDTSPDLVPAIAIRLVYASPSVARVLLRSVADGDSRAVSPWVTASPDGSDTVVTAYVRGLSPASVQTLQARALSVAGIEALSAPREVSST